MRGRHGTLELIGNTPLVRVDCFDTAGSELWLKLESRNPGGSIKDRIGLSMIEAAEADGRLAPGGHIIEATAGNTGLALALVAALRGYKLTLVVPDKMSRHCHSQLRALGAEVIWTRSDVHKGHYAHYQDMAQRLAAEHGWFHVDQFGNPANPAAHEHGTAPEIWAQTGQRLDAIVCGVGSGGTITGMSRFFAKVDPNVEIVLADPKGSVLAGVVETGTVGEAGSWLVEGIGEDFVPPICDLSRVKRAYTIDDREAFALVRDLLSKAGILAGTSTGVLVGAALAWCRDRAKAPGKVVTFVCDSGAGYLSKAFRDEWLHEQGLLDRPRYGDLRDVVSRRAGDAQLVAVAPDDALRVAYARMRLHDVSQLPVLDRGALVGIIDESDLLVASLDTFDRRVRDVMSSKVETLAPNAPFEELVRVLDRGLVGVIVDKGALFGLITRIDLVNYLRRRTEAR